ncbi:hypothetical protein [Saliniramus sp.]|uniref:hypothetical protein n=1 Tax=Saliniramus sp. TaxID=2986772 RepID=UPI002C5EBD46|nr:hypothetical protein [Saliniramus sp.]HMB09932.1 hypothetical protein [Saliniramus sp.]
MIFSNFEKAVCKIAADRPQPIIQFSNAMRDADPLSDDNLLLIDKPKTEKDKDVPLDDAPGRRYDPNFQIPEAFRIHPQPYLNDFLNGIPSRIL